MTVSSKAWRMLAVTVAVVHIASPGSALAQGSCAGDEEFALLDFWVGEWEVRMGNRKVGANRIEKIVGGCALLENWTDTRGGEGKSLFYRVPSEDAWKQVWVTPSPKTSGGVKEKALVEVLDDGGTVFRGTITIDGIPVLDQTTLTPLPDGTVRQVIEHSRDGGSTWRRMFEAIYYPVDATPEEAP